MAQETYEHLNRWKRPQYYMGAEWPEHYSAGVGQSRDSNALERSNFQAMCAALEQLPELDVDGETSWRIVRESHWAVGWVEWIAIHESDTARLECANRIMAGMEDYPVIDEDLLSQLEDEECSAVWSTCMDARERIEYFRRHGWSNYPFPGTSKFSMLRQAINGDWSFAANMLHCPSDLIA